MAERQYGQARPAGGALPVRVAFAPYPPAPQGPSMTVRPVPRLPPCIGTAGRP
jgi:hypothetical protein